MEASILKTNDYSKFSLHYKNRRINLKKVERLAEKMKEKNLLPIYPIVVNGKNEILDGQHRYEAAKKAKVTISYVVSDDGMYDIGDVAESNNFQSHWKTSDFINYYAKEGRQVYLNIQSLAKKYGLETSRIANMSDTKKITEEIKSGKFQFADYNEVVEVLKHARAMDIEFAFPYWKSRPFLRALKHIMGCKGYEKLRMGQKIMANRGKLVKCHTSLEYINILEEIYNTKALTKVRFL